MKSAEEIIEKLKSSFNAPSRKDEKIKVVVFCVIISATFWLFSALNKTDYTTQIQYPVSFEYDPDKYIAVQPLPTRLAIDVTGGGWDLMTRSMGFGMRPLVIRLENPADTKFRLTSTLRGELSSKLENLNLNFILSDRLAYNIERKITRKIPLRLDSSALSLDENHQITSPITLTPDSILLTGPESFIESFAEPMQIPVGSDLSYGENVNENFDVPELGSPLIEANLSEVNVQFNVTAFIPGEKGIRVALTGTEDSTITLIPPIVLASYRKSELDESTLDSLDLLVSADWTKMNPLDSTIQLDVLYAVPYIIDLKLTPEKVKVNFNE